MVPSLKPFQSCCLSQRVIQRVKLVAYNAFLQQLIHHATVEIYTPVPAFEDMTFCQQVCHWSSLTIKVSQLIDSLSHTSWHNFHVSGRHRMVGFIGTVTHKIIFGIPDSNDAILHHPGCHNRWLVPCFRDSWYIYQSCTQRIPNYPSDGSHHGHPLLKNHEKLMVLDVIDVRRICNFHAILFMVTWCLKCHRRLRFRYHEKMTHFSSYHTSLW